MAGIPIPEDKDIIGQTHARRLCRVFVESCSPMHILLVGPPGIGKTTFALWYGALWGAVGNPIIGTNVAEKLDAIRQFKGSVIIDECHTMTEPESIYPLVDKRPIEMGRSDSDQADTYAKVYAFTTTDEGEMPPALVSRLVKIALRPYNTEEIALIGRMVAPHLRDDTLHRVAVFAKGSPRRVKLLADVLDKMATNRNHILLPSEVEETLAFLGYAQGLDQREVEYLRALDGGPHSLSTLMTMFGAGAATVKMWEGELVRLGLVSITSKGRVLTMEGEMVLRKLGGL